MMKFTIILLSMSEAINEGLPPKSFWEKFRARNIILSAESTQLNNKFSVNVRKTIDESYLLFLEKGNKTLDKVEVENRVSALVFNPQGDKIAAAGNNILRIFSIEQNKLKEISEFKTSDICWGKDRRDHPEAENINIIKFHPSGYKIAIGGPTVDLHLLSLEGINDKNKKPKLLLKYRPKNYLILSMAFNEQEDKLAIGCERDLYFTDVYFERKPLDGILQVISLKNIDGKSKPEIIAKFKSPLPINTVDFNPEGDKIMATTDESKLTFSLEK